MSKLHEVGTKLYYIGSMSATTEVEVIAHRHGMMVIEHIDGGTGVWNDTSYLLVDMDELAVTQPEKKQVNQPFCAGLEVNYSVPCDMPE